MDAYLYARWSSLEQGVGSTLERQLANTAKFAKRQNWTIASTVKDAGKSAYTGANIGEKGNLGAFARKVMCGEIDARRSVLVVEELDRLSRQPAPVMLAWLAPLLGAGLTVAVTQTGQMLTMEMLSTDIAGLLTVVLESFGSHKESKKKSERVADAWRQRRENVAAGEIVAKNHRRPQWIIVNGDDYEIDNLRGRLVREMFDLRLRGYGKGAIAKVFNERFAKGDTDYDTWPLKEKKARQWTATYVGRVLCHLGAVGLWQPCLFPRGGERTPIGKPLKLYPAVVDQETFDRANESRFCNQLKAQGRGRGISNLLGSKARCAKCGGVMDALGSSRYRRNKSGTVSRHYFLYCRTAKVGGGTCDHVRGWTYDNVEAPILDNILTSAMDEQHFASNDNEAVHLMERDVFRLRRLVEERLAGARAILAMVRKSPADGLLSAEYDDAATELSSSKDALTKAEKALAAARGRVSASEHVRRVTEVRKLMMSDDPDERYQARSRVKAALQELIDRVEFDHERNLVAVYLAAGIGLLLIYPDQRVAFFELLHPTRSRGGMTADHQALIAAYARRKEADVV